MALGGPGRPVLRTALRTGWGAEASALGCGSGDPARRPGGGALLFGRACRSLALTRIRSVSPTNASVSAIFCSSSHG